ALPIWRYTYLTAGHHGVMWGASALRGARTSGSLVGRGAWKQARRDAVEWLIAAFGIPVPLPGNLASARLTYEDAIFLAGLVTAADWLGSDERYFKYLREPVSPEEARATALARANRAMGASGWYQQPIAIPAGNFGDAIRSLPPNAA